jgi:hypothetical protein
MKPPTPPTATGRSGAPLRDVVDLGCLIAGLPVTLPSALTLTSVLLKGLV